MTIKVTKNFINSLQEDASKTWLEKFETLIAAMKVDGLIDYNICLFSDSEDIVSAEEVARNSFLMHAAYLNGDFNLLHRSSPIGAADSAGVS